MTRPHPAIDRGKLRAHARRLEGKALLVWIDRAINLLPEDALPALIADYVRAEDLAPDPGSQPDRRRRQALEIVRKKQLRPVSALVGADLC